MREIKGASPGFDSRRLHNDNDRLRDSRGWHGQILSSWGRPVKVGGLTLYLPDCPPQRHTLAVYSHPMVSER